MEHLHLSPPSRSSTKSPPFTPSNIRPLSFVQKPRHRKKTPLFPPRPRSLTRHQQPHPPLRLLRLPPPCPQPLSPFTISKSPLLQTNHSLAFSQ
ncbi:hypothetical protein TSUD_95980 [Trifolium subterraneum]|uniref:Uncharacterized protein n=1 Tax=Trifolium subterraneum TaxID=3900 RepID=A0A2Z6PAF1_TRISU|nr:hypothetical protein TSUD_95980 [Trifolium subterraneum]